MFLISSKEKEIFIVESSLKKLGFGCSVHLPCRCALFFLNQQFNYYILQGNNGGNHSRLIIVNTTIYLKDQLALILRHGIKVACRIPCKWHVSDRKRALLIIWWCHWLITQILSKVTSHHRYVMKDPNSHMKMNYGLVFR